MAKITVVYATWRLRRPKLCLRKLFDVVKQFSSCYIDKEHRQEPLFLSQSNKKMTVACVRSIVKKYVTLAKEKYPDLFPFKNYSPHSFRHSKAIHMVEAGVSIIYIRNFLGHATISSTEIYARVGQAAVTKALTDRKIPRIAPTNIQNEIDNATCPLPDFIKSAR